VRPAGAGREETEAPRLGRVAIVGAGQVGTMLGLALRRAGACAEVGLLDRSPVVAEASLARGAGDRLLQTAHEALAFDVLVVALPVPEIVRFVEAWGPQIREGTLLLDTGSAKCVVVEAMRRVVPLSVHAVGGHPIAGTERRGPDGADPSLLRGAPFVLTPVREDAEGLRRSRALAAAVGAVPFEMDAGTHDRVVARTSHLPHLAAFALARVAEGVASPEVVRTLGSSGLAGATRLAASDPVLVGGFLSANAEEVRAAARELVDALEGLVRAVDRGVEAAAGALAGPAEDAPRLREGP
jgi:prephenate dehydrogenase